jgi:hypothetical protein
MGNSMFREPPKSKTARTRKLHSVRMRVHKEGQEVWVGTSALESQSDSLCLVQWAEGSHERFMS